VSATTVLYVLGMIAAFVVAYLVVLSAFAGRVGVQLLAACILTVLVAAVARELALSVAETRARTQRLAVLGRFSAQMAHDIKGPLTALIGAVQVLDGAADDRDTQKEFLGLVSEQAKRIGAIVDRYDRMARVEPRKTLVRVNDVVRSVARAHGVPDDTEHLRFAAGDLECDADPALLESAIENVVRNAVEASSSADAVTLATQIDDPSRTVVIRVVDRGTGMDARVLERAVEDFFTTKTDGSGLGLAFVRRVLEAHGGTMTLASRPAPHPEQGTTVELRLPFR
jgi:signal transduction histidine kinase